MTLACAEALAAAACQHPRQRAEESAQTQNKPPLLQETITCRAAALMPDLSDQLSGKPLANQYCGYYQLRAFQAKKIGNISKDAADAKIRF